MKRVAPRIAPLILAGLSLPAYAFQPLVTDDTGTQGSGGNQLEGSISEDRAGTSGGTVQLRNLPFVYTRGLTTTLDVYAGFAHTRIRSGAPGNDASGAGNPAFGAKWRFYDDEPSKTSVAIKPEMLFPVSFDHENADLGNGRTSGSLTLILTKEVPFGAIHLNAGVAKDRYRDVSNHSDTTTTRASFAPVWDLTEQWKLALDLGIDSAHAAGARIRSNFVELGAIYSPNKDLDFALGIVRASDSTSPRTTTHTATAGVTWRFQ